MFRLAKIGGIGSETGGNWPGWRRRALTATRGEGHSFPGPGSGAPLGSWPERVEAAHTCTPWPCSWSTRARKVLIPLRRASRCSAEEIPRLARSLQRRASQTEPAQPHLLLSRPSSEQGRAQNLDRPFTLTGAVGSSDSLGSHGSHGFQAPVASCSEAVLVAAQVQGLQPRTHGTKGGEGGEGTVLQRGGRPGGRRQWSGDSRDLVPSPGHSPVERPVRKDRRRDSNWAPGQTWLRCNSLFTWPSM